MSGVERYNRRGEQLVTVTSNPVAEAEQFVRFTDYEALEAYAKEGWDWLSEALDALGVEDVFGIKEAEAQRDTAREAALEEAAAEFERRCNGKPNTHGTFERQAFGRAAKFCRQLADTPAVQEEEENDGS